MRIALLISGGGTTAAAIIRACKTGGLNKVEPVLVIASAPGIGGIKKVLALGISLKDVAVINPKNFLTAEDFGEKILDECQKRNVEFISQNGWLCLTPKNVVDKYNGMMINQHPGPLDPGRADFGGKGMFGLRVHCARLGFVRRTNRDFWNEATAQRVAINFDAGAVLNRKQVPILPKDTPETLAARLLPIEHEVIIETLQNFANNSIKEITRDAPLIKPEEYEILAECKKQAIRLYPKG